MKTSLLGSVVLSMILAPYTMAAGVPSAVGHGLQEVSVGAAYTMTNRPDGNTLIVLSINNNGTLSYSSSYKSGGVGSRGQGSPIGDALFSTGSIVVHQERNLLVHTNPGSNTLTMYSVDPTDPTKLKMLGEPISSGGDYPNSLDFNKAGDRICALNTGTNNAVQCFNVDEKKGMSAIKSTYRPLGINQTVPATGPQNTVGHVRFSQDETKLFVTYKGYDAIGTKGHLAIFDILQGSGNGRLATKELMISQDNKKIFTDRVGRRPFQMTFIEGRNAILSADPIVGFDIWDLDAGTSTSNIIPDAGTNCWSVWSPKTGNYYLMDADHSRISEVSIDLNQVPLTTGKVVNQYFKEKGSFLADTNIATIGDKEYLYTLAAGQVSIFVSDLRGPGNATQIQNFDLKKPVRGDGVKIDLDHIQGFTVFMKKANDDDA